MGRKPSKGTITVEEAMEALAVLDLVEEAIRLARKGLRAVAGLADGNERKAA